MNKIITSVDNMVDRLLLISDKTRFPDTSWDKAQNYNETALPPELFRKLKFTAVSVMTNPEMIEAFPDVLISSQFILINPNNIKDFIINDKNMPFDEALVKEEKLKKFITDLLEESLTKKLTDDSNLIKLVSIYDKEESKVMDILSFKGNQFKNISEYVKNDGDVMSLPGQNEVDKEMSSQQHLQSFIENFQIPSDRKYPKNLLKGEKFNQFVAQEMKIFLTHYDSASSDSLKNYVCCGFASKILPQMKSFRKSTILKTWEFIGEGAKLEEFPNLIRINNVYKDKTSELKNEVREAIAHAVHPSINETERDLLIKGISSFSRIEGKNSSFSNGLDYYSTKRLEKDSRYKRKTI